MVQCLTNPIVDLFTKTHLQWELSRAVADMSKRMSPCYSFYSEGYNRNKEKQYIYHQRKPTLLDNGGIKWIKKG